MTRSGGFNVPNDFFKVQGRMPAPVPATPVEHERRRWPLIAGAAGVLVAVGLVIAIFANSTASPASPPVTTAPPVDTVPAPPATANDTVPTLPVAIAVEPIDAEVIRDGVSLGTSPIVVGVQEGKTVELVVQRPGYVSQNLSLDGKKSKMMVRLEHEKPVVTPSRPRPPAARPPASPPVQDPPKPRPKPQVGGGEIVNPWAK
jgi:hypothetical protein